MYCFRGAEALVDFHRTTAPAGPGQTPAPAATPPARLTMAQPRTALAAMVTFLAGATYILWRRSRSNEVRHRETNTPPLAHRRQTENRPRAAIVREPLDIIFVHPDCITLNLSTSTFCGCLVVCVSCVGVSVCRCVLCIAKSPPCV